MGEKIDLRIQKTRKALIESLSALLKKKPFEDITVSELCELAMVRRATFYQHFTDKYDLFNYMIQSMRRIHDEESDRDIANMSTQEYLVYKFCEILNYLENNEEIISRIIRSTTSYSMLNSLSDQLEKDIFQKIKNTASKSDWDSLHAETVAAFYKGAIMQTSRYWIFNRDKIDKAVIIGTFEALISKMN